MIGFRAFLLLGCLPRGASLSRHRGADLARDLEVLARLDDERPHRAAAGADVGVAARGGVALRVERDAEEPEAGRGGRAHLRRCARRRRR